MNDTQKIKPNITVIILTGNEEMHITRAIENVQRRLTKLLPHLTDLSYEENLRALRLTTLQFRRNRMDMIQLFKIIANIDNISSIELFQFSTTETRGHSFKLHKPRK